VSFPKIFLGPLCPLAGPKVPWGLRLKAVLWYPSPNWAPNRAASSLSIP
jgi:hypothetical protein